jgi:LCP family protein required for cell wall assembly
MDTPRADRRMLLRALLAAVIIVIATAGASSTAALLKIDDLLPDPQPDQIIPDLPDHGSDQLLEKPKPGKPQTLLLIGSDGRWKKDDEDPARSDTMMLVRMDDDQKATTVLSIPRDLRVQIPGHGLAKINDSFALGGPKLTVETIKSITGLKIHGVANVNFKGFRKAINYFDCFYVDVDRRYYHSNVGVPIGQRYDAIDIPPGYQKLCGIKALDYARYRHTDTDLVRAARQQDLLRAAKDQITDQISKRSLQDQLKDLGEIVAESMQTNGRLREKAGFISIAKLALASRDHPVRQVEFPATFVDEGTDDGQKISYVESSQDQIAGVVFQFLHGGQTQAEVDGTAPKKKATPKRKRGSVKAAELREARDEGAKLVRDTGRRATRLGFPVRFPSHLTQRGRYDDKLRLYELRDRDGTLQKAYRFTVAEDEVNGQFYGVQGTTWKDPPLLKNWSKIRRIKGRKLYLYRAGSKLRFVAWRTDSASYWISNTLNMKLSEDEMLALAASLTTAK